MITVAAELSITDFFVQKTLGCRLTLIYDEYLIVRMVYYDYHRMVRDWRGTVTSGYGENI